MDQGPSAYPTTLACPAGYNFFAAVKSFDAISGNFVSNAKNSIGEVVGGSNFLSVCTVRDHKKGGTPLMCDIEIVRARMR